MTAGAQSRGPLAVPGVAQAEAGGSRVLWSLPSLLPSHCGSGHGAYFIMKRSEAAKAMVLMGFPFVRRVGTH